MVDVDNKDYMWEKNCETNKFNIKKKYKNKILTSIKHNKQIFIVSLHS